MFLCNLELFSFIVEQLLHVCASCFTSIHAQVLVHAQVYDTMYMKAGIVDK